MIINTLGSSNSLVDVSMIYYRIIPPSRIVISSSIHPYLLYHDLTRQHYICHFKELTHLANYANIALPYGPVKVRKVCKVCSNDIFLQKSLLLIRTRI